jgi:hypothetical protein
MKYTATGPMCGTTGTSENGKLNGAWNLKGPAFGAETMVEGEIKYLGGAQQGIWDE